MLSYVVGGFVIVIGIFLYLSRYLSRGELYAVLLTLLIAEVFLVFLAFRSRDSLTSWFLVLTPVTVTILYSMAFRVSTSVLKTQPETVLQLLQRLHSQVYDKISSVRRKSTSN